MKKAAIVALLILAFILSVAYYTYAGISEYKQNKIASKYYDQKQYGELYDFYFDPQPSIAQRHFTGSPDASVTVAAVIDPLAQQSRDFLNTTIAHIERAYVETGQIKLYFKYYMTEEEYVEKRGRFIYGAAGQCYNGTDSVAFHQELLATEETAIPALLKKHGLPENPLECSSDDLLYEDMTESHLFRIVSPSVHISINGTGDAALVNPSVERLDSELKFTLISLGI